MQGCSPGCAACMPGREQKHKPGARARTWGDDAAAGRPLAQQALQRGGRLLGKALAQEGARQAGQVGEEPQRRLHNRHAPVLRPQRGRGASRVEGAHLVSAGWGNRGACWLASAGAWDAAVASGCLGWGRPSAPWRCRTCSAPMSGAHARCTLGSRRGVSGSGPATLAGSRRTSSWICKRRAGGRRAAFDGCNGLMCTAVLPHSSKAV